MVSFYSEIFSFFSHRAFNRCACVLFLEAPLPPRYYFCVIHTCHGILQRGGFHFFQCLLVIGRSQLFFTFFIGRKRVHLRTFPARRIALLVQRCLILGSPSLATEGIFLHLKFCLSFRGIWPLCLAMSLLPRSTKRSIRDQDLLKSYWDYILTEVQSCLGITRNQTQRFKVASMVLGLLDLMFESFEERIDRNVQKR